MSQEFQSSLPTPPQARREPHPTTLHGQTLQDDFFWLRDKSSPEVIAYLDAENAYAAAVMEPTRTLQDELYQEMLSHIQETDQSVPVANRGWLYYSRTVQGSQYGIHCRRQQTASGEPDAPEQVMLDVNLLAVGQPFMSLGDMAVSPDGNLLAYSTDNTGFRQYTLHIRDLRTGQDLLDSAPRTGSLAWAADSRTLLYTTEDEETKRHNKLFRHTVGSPAGEEHDALVLEETDERFNLGVGVTRDRQYLVIASGSHTTTECRFLPASDPLAEPVLMAPRVDDQEYHPDHREGLWYIRTNDTAKNFRLVTAPVVTPGREHWTELYHAAEEIPLEDFDLFRLFCVLTERKGGLPHLAVYALEGAQPALQAPKEITFPEPAYSAGTAANPEFATRTLRYSYTSLVSPASVYAYDVESGESTLLKEQPVPGGFDRSRYASERLWVPVKEASGEDLGAKVPVSLVYRRDRFRQDGSSPLYIYGYGSYGYALPVGFSATRLSLLDRGLVLAYAHIRGGGELGDAWHDAGKMMRKRNTFTDFVAVTEHLLDKGYGDRQRVAAEGGSAGGLLMGAIMNLRPELYRAVLSHVPFVDVMNTMLDASLPLTVAEYEEWGNPNEPEAFRYMLSYSPYDNLEQLKGKTLPALLVKTSLNDSQVMYWEPAKYTARLRTLHPATEHPLLLHTNMEAGHGGASGRYDYLKEIAFDYAFLLRELGRVEADAW